MIKKVLNKSKILLLCLTVFLIFGLAYFLTYNFVEPKVYDFMTKNVLTEKLPFDEDKNVYGSDDIVLVVIDKKTVEKYRYPWKRDVNCKIFNYFLEYAKPKLIINDSTLVTLDKDYPESDRAYFKTLKMFNNLVVGFMPGMLGWEDKAAGAVYEDFFASKYSLNIKNDLSPAYVIFNGMMKSPELYLDSIKNIGSVYTPHGALNRNLTWSFDQISRTQEYFIIYKNAVYPSICMKAFLILNNNPQIVINDKKIDIGSPVNYSIKLLNKAFLYNGLQKVTFQTVSTPTKFYKLYGNGYSHKKYSAVDIMDSYEAIRAGKKPSINPNEFMDKIVMVGANVPTGTGLNDNINTPLTVNHPGVDVQATALDNLIHNDFINVISQAVNIIIAIIGMLLVFFSIRAFNLVKSILAAVFIVIAYILLGTMCFYFGIIINIATPVSMFVLTTIFAYTNKFVIENKSKEKVKAAMGKYMSEDVMQNVVKNIDNLGLGGKRAVVTVLFADIRGFTSISEKMSAQQVSELLNEYFTEMEPIISGYNGIINKFIGDAIMAIFGEPIQDDNHAKNAVICAYKMLEHVQQLHKKWKKEGKPQIDIGIGINTGEVFVGNIGSVNRMEYTVIGDTVNLASRLESYNKMYRTKMLISSSTYNHVKEFADVLKISDVRIRGKANKIDIYEVLKVNMDKI